MTTRHEFLAMLHYLLQPRGYLEIGVQYGDSLALAQCPAVGVDPDPRVLPINERPNAHIYEATADHFFQQVARAGEPIQFLPEYIDLAFIDGSHLAEDALDDFANIEHHANPRTVVVFDDMLPRNQHEATREPHPGDWTGDVWRIQTILRKHRPYLYIAAVDTEPTGTLVVAGFGKPPQDLPGIEPAQVEVHRSVLERWWALEPTNVIDALMKWRASWT